MEPITGREQDENTEKENKKMEIPANYKYEKKESMNNLFEKATTTNWRLTGRQGKDRRGTSRVQAIKKYLQINVVYYPMR